VRSIVAAALWCCVLVCPAAAQDPDVIARARAAAADGRRGEGLALLEQHLAASPRDVDARLVYGLILSWDGQYDAARTALAQVLADAPDYHDARVALMNVEWWSGRLDQARTLNRAVLARDPGNAQARLVQQRLDARTRPWSASLTYVHDAFDDDRDPWHETAIAIGRETPAGAVIVRGSAATRFGLDDRQIDVEFYPVFRAGTYAFVGVGAGADDTLYPQHRVGFELYQSLGNGFEVSGGFRRLAFADAATLYLATLTKYAGNWMLSGKAQVAPDDRLGDAWSYHANARRYFGAAGRSFVGAAYGYGFTREEPRGAGDLLRLNANTIRGQAEIDLRQERMRLSLHAGGSRQERAAGASWWQTTAGGGITFRF
jgi:YaiO family outer membrane protein